MLSQETLNKLENLAAQVAEREGCLLYDLDFSGTASGRTLRVFIDKQGGGASVDDCANVSRSLNTLLDTEDPIPGGAYNLEISTPGLERTLKKKWHFAEAKGKKIWVRLSQNLESLGLQNKTLALGKQLTEVLQDVTESGIQFQIGEELLTVPLSAIEKAHVVFEFGQAQDKGKDNEKGKDKKSIGAQNKFKKNKKS